MGKTRIKNIRGKRVVLTNDANLIDKNEIGIIEKPDGKVEVKEYNKSGVLQDIAGGSNSNKECDDVAYYKIVENNEPLYVGDYYLGTPSELFYSSLYKCVLLTSKILSFKLNDEFSKFGIISEVVSLTGSEDINPGTNIISTLEELIIIKKLKAFQIYKGPYSLFNTRGGEFNAYHKLPYGDLFEKIHYMLTSTGAPSEEVEFFTVIFKKSIIPISKEEYDTI